MCSEIRKSNALLLFQLYKAPKEGFTDLDKSLETLMAKLNGMDIKAVKWESDFGVSYFEWPGFMDIAAMVTSTGVGVGIYNVLKLWLGSKDGRRFRIKLGDIEVESSQLNEKHFLEFLEKVLKIHSTFEGKASMSKNKIPPKDEEKRKFDKSTFHHNITIDEFYKIHQGIDSKDIEKDNDQTKL